jgi:serine/threonine protein kinase
MTPPPAGKLVASSRSCHDRANSGQGKDFAAANANAVDTAKTLARSSVRVSDERSRRSGELLLARYRLLERLGTGGFGTVWRAHDEALDRTVAVKRIPLPGDEDRERATREAHATARLAHPAIVSLYEACADEDAFYLISELIEGHTLAQLIADDELADEEILDIGLSLCEALEHAHTRGVVHRDVKPHNVLVPSEHTRDTPSRGTTTTVAAKLADFGGARLAGDDALTRTGEVLGTLAYMAPEQSEGHEAGTAADLYSLALVLYEALTGVNPVRGRTPAATARRIGEPIESLARRRRDLPRELTRAIDLALDPAPAGRGTLADLHDALTGALERGSKRRLLAPRSRRGVAPHEREARDRNTRVRPRHGIAEGELRPDERPGEHPVEQLRAEAQRHSGQANVEAEPHTPRQRTRAALPRTIWIGCLLALAAYQAAAARPGVALLVLAAGAPLLVLPRRSGPGWLAASLAPVLGLVGLAGAFPALAAQRAGWLARAALAGLGFWWLALAESLLDRRLWLGPPSALPSRAVWEGSLSNAATHVLAATLTFELLLGAAVWALAAAILPWLVRGRNAALDALLAFAWTVALLAATPVLSGALLSHQSQPTPRGAVLGAGVGCALAVCARALRGPI